MAEVYAYDGTHLTTVKDGSVELVESADHGNIGSGRLTIDDVAGTQAIVGHKSMVITQSACSFTRTFTGYVGERSYHRGVPAVVGSREIDVTLLDLNARLGFKVIRGTRPSSSTSGNNGNRKRETISNRLTWLLQTSYLSSLVADNGNVTYPTTVVDKNDYRGQFPVDVLRDMALIGGLNFYVYWDATSGASLWFSDANASTAFQSTLRISNVSTDIDESTTFAAGDDAELTRDPSEVVSGLLMPFQRGNVYRTRAATETTYQPRDGVAPSANVKTRTRAQNLADRYLFARRNENDVVRDTIVLPDDKVNLIRAGQRIQAKYSHFNTEGYGAFSWYRILEVTKKPRNADAGEYDVGLTLSPQEGGCSTTPTKVQAKLQDGVDTPGGTQWQRTFTFASPSTPGNLIVLACKSSIGVGNVLAAPAGWTWVVQNMNLKADNSNDIFNVFYKKSEGEQVCEPAFQATGGDQPEGALIEYAGLTNPVLSGSAVTNRQEGLGYATVGSTSYPSGIALVLSIVGMNGGPQSGDHLTVSGTGHSLAYPVDSAIPDPNPYIPDIGMGHSLHTSASSSGSASDWQFNFTGTEPTLTVGLVFTGDVC